jgi:hypothetical protein
MSPGIKAFIVASLLTVLPLGYSHGASVLMYHNDLSSDGLNSTETTLTTSNLTTSTFSKLYSVTMDGQVYAQPLYVPGVTVTSGPQAGKHNLVIVATENASVYAIDADSGAIVWQTSLLTTGLAGATSITVIPASDTGTTLISPLIGITGTPVIDGTTNMLFVCASTKQIINNATSTPSYVYGIYQIDITNGDATANANIVASNLFADTIYNGSAYTFRTNNDPTAAQDPFVFGTGNGEITVNGTKRVYFNGFKELDRCGLILTGGTIYAAFASHADSSPYHGWLIGFNESNLAINAVSNFTPAGGLGGIWNSGGTPVVDSNGYIYVMTGNGTFDGNNTSGITGLNGQNMPAKGDYGDSIVRLSTDSTTSQGSQNINGWGLKVLDYFAPYNNQSLSSNDSDVGSGGTVLLPTSAGSTTIPNLIVGAGKQGNIYLCNTSNLGQYGTSDSVVQSEVAIDGSFDTPAFFNGELYYFGEGDDGKAFSVSNAAMSTSPVSSTTSTIGFPGATPAISANGTSNGIVWVINYNGGSSSSLRAYSAASLATMLWNSTLASGSRDALGAATKFSAPAVADGHVFVGTQTALVTYGLSSVAPLLTSGTPPNGTAGVAYNFNYPATGAPFPAFSKTNGSLPGLTLTTAGNLSGTPNSPGTFSGTVTASNGVSPAATQNFDITIANTYSFWTSQEGLSGNQALPTTVVSPDGITNLMKYALGLNPFTIYNPGSAGLPYVQIQKFSGTPYLTLTFNGIATDVTYAVQATSNLSSGWTTIYSSTAGQAPGTMTVQDTQPESSSATRYMRLQVSQ